MLFLACFQPLPDVLSSFEEEFLKSDKKRRVSIESCNLLRNMAGYFQAMLGLFFNYHQFVGFIS